MALPARLSQNRPRGLFGASASAPQQMPVSAMDGGINDPAAAPKKGFDWRKALGVLGDSLSIAGGGQPVYVPNLIDQRNRQQAMAYAEQQYQRRRQDEWTDWQQRQQYEAQHPKPVNNDTVNDYQFLAEKLGPDAAKQYLQNIADGPPIAVDVSNPDGSVTRQFIPRSQMQGSASVPQAPVGKLTPYNGGPTPTASGGFR